MTRQAPPHKGRCLLPPTSTAASSTRPARQVPASQRPDRPARWSCPPRCRRDPCTGRHRGSGRRCQTRPGDADGGRTARDHVAGQQHVERARRVGGGDHPARERVGHRRATPRQHAGAVVAGCRRQPVCTASFDAVVAGIHRGRSIRREQQHVVIVVGTGIRLAQLESRRRWCPPER